MRPQVFNLKTNIDEEGNPICRVNLFNVEPKIENFILCLRVKNAEVGDRRKGYDEIYTGYLDGKIISNKIVNDETIKTKILWEGKKPISNQY